MVWSPGRRDLQRRFWGNDDSLIWLRHEAGRYAGTSLRWAGRNVQSIQWNKGEADLRGEELVGYPICRAEIIL